MEATTRKVGSLARIDSRNQSRDGSIHLTDFWQEEAVDKVTRQNHGNKATNEESDDNDAHLADMKRNQGKVARTSSWDKTL